MKETSEVTCLKIHSGWFLQINDIDSEPPWSLIFFNFRGVSLSSSNILIKSLSKCINRSIYAQSKIILPRKYPRKISRIYNFCQNLWWKSPWKKLRWRDPKKMAKNKIDVFSSGTMIPFERWIFRQRHRLGLHELFLMNILELFQHLLNRMLLKINHNFGIVRRLCKI